MTNYSKNKSPLGTMAMALAGAIALVATPVMASALTQSSDSQSSTEISAQKDAVKVTASSTKKDEKKKKKKKTSVPTKQGS